MMEFLWILPEIYLVIAIIGLMIAQITFVGERVRLTVLIVLGVLLAAFVDLAFPYRPGYEKIFFSSLSIDEFARFFRLLFLALGALSVSIGYFSNEISKKDWPGYCIFILSGVLALNFAVMSNDLLLTYVSMQLLAISSWMLAGFSLGRKRSSEAAIKLMVMNVAGFAFFLIAAATLFSFTQSLNLFEVKALLMNRALPVDMAMVIFSLIFLSLCILLGAFPAFFWVPDVVDGSPTPNTLFLAVAMPAAGLAIAIRIFSGVFLVDLREVMDWEQVVAWASGLTMMMGALLALRQQGARRMIAFLFVSQSGFGLMGLLVLNVGGVSAALYHLVVLMVSFAGVIAGLCFLFNELKTDRIEAFYGKMSRAIPECGCLIFFLGCFIGIPPSPGFIGKFALIQAIMAKGWYGLAIVSIVSGVLMVTSFGKIAFQLVGGFSAVQNSNVQGGTGFRVLILSIAIPILGLGIWADAILKWTGESFIYLLR